MNAGIAEARRHAAASEHPGRAPGAAPQAIASWLLAGGIQSAVDLHRGGVAGWLDAAGRVEYVYPEITGYYLQWLAWTATSEGASARLAYGATMAQQWLATWVQHKDPPQTRVHLDADCDDWRNDAVFFFDLAMVLRGIASATRTGLIKPDDVLVGNLAAQLSRLVAVDGMFDSCRAIDRRASLPDRWSTRRGGFLAKAAAGVLSASEILPQVGAKLRHAAAATMTASLDAAIGRPHDETHPALYAIEGALSLSDRHAIAPLLPALTNQIDMLLTHAAARDGWLPESRSRTGVRRLDIVAQALRAAVLLRARCVDWSPDPQAVEKMRQLLVRYITPVGALPFAPHATSPQFNTWCAMFAEQSLQAAASGVARSRLYDVEACLI